MPGQGRGKAAFLSAEQQAAVAAQAATGAFRTAAAAGAWIAAQFGVSYRDGGLSALLGRLDMHPKVPRPVNPKADLDAQDQWKKGGSPMR